MLLGHGGNIKEVIDKYRILQNKILDFSSNINPLGISHKIKDIITNSIHLINQYPDPEYKSARLALSKWWGIDRDNFLLGNGSNEFIHLLPRALKCSRALIYQPTFSEYESGIRLAGAKPYFLKALEEDGFRIDIKKIIKFVPKVDLIILCNPNNPTGYLLKRNELLSLLNVCQRNKIYLFIDEVFMEFVDGQDKYSLLKDAAHEEYLLVLRSLTKFFSLAGLRAGYLVGEKNLLSKIMLFQPTWSVNCFAQKIIAEGLFQPTFIKKSRDYIKKARNFLYDNLKKIRGIQTYYPVANFIFCKIVDKKLNSKSLCSHLIKRRILIRDCSNFKGLDNHFFRVAVRKREDNLYLIECLREIFR